MPQKQLRVRNSAIELLRIISMIMIVFHHFAIHGEFEFESTFSITHFWYNFILMGGKIGVNIFVLISGYYLINNDKKNFDLIKIVKFVGQVFFYSMGIFLICKLTGVIDWNTKYFVKALLPITFSQWWFVSAYFVLYLIHPFLNKLLHNLDKTSYQNLLLILVISWSIIPTFTTSSFQSNSLLWFVTLYSISGYIRLYGFNKKFTAKHYFVFGLVCSILTYSSSVIFIALGNKWPIFAKYATYFYGQEKITTLLISLCTFMFFTLLKMNYNKWVNIIASTTFGVYLIHDNMIVRNLLWSEWFKNAQYQENIFLIPYSIFVVVIVYTFCSFIDLLRQYIFEKPFLKLLKHYSYIKIVPLKKTTNLLKNYIFGK